MSSVTTPAGRRASRSADSEVSGGAGHRAASRATYLLVLILFSLFAWAPLLYPGYLQVHSGFLPVFNLADLAVSPGKLTWVSTIGMAPDLLRGEGPLAYWLALVLRPIAGNTGAVKGVFAFSILVGGLGVAAWARLGLAGWHPERDITERAALLAAVVFMLWPPLLATVYVRGALAEAVFMGLMPWALAGVAGVTCRVSGKRRAQGGTGPSDAVAGPGLSRFPWGAMIGAIGVIALLFFAQPGLALWATALLAVWAIWPGAPMKARLAAAGAVAAGAAVGLGLLWLRVGGAGRTGQFGDMAAHAIYPYQLFSPAWSFGISTPDWKGDLPLQLGLAALALAMMTVVLGFASTRAQGEPVTSTPPAGFWTSALGFSLATGLALIALTTTVARPLWGSVPALASSLTYPWQLFALVGPLLALLAGAVLVVDRRLALLPMTAGLLAFVVLASAPALSPRFTQVDPGPAPAALFGGNQIALLTAKASFAPDRAPSTGSTSTLLPEPSTPLTVTLTWQALQPIDQDYNLFVHALDNAGNTVAQWDGQPLRGQEPFPMTQWPVGAIVPTTVRLEAPQGQAASVRQVVAGLYDWQTGARLPAGDDDKVILAPTAAPGSEVAP